MPLPRNPRIKPTGKLKRFTDAGKSNSRLLVDIERYLLGVPQNPDRDMTKLHVSEMAHPRWCPRQSFYRISGAAGLEEEPARFQLETIWEEGNQIGRKWQGWVHALGRLRGQWRCLNCQLEWNATSPGECPSCGSQAIEYREVPAYSEEYQILAHADGDIDEGTDDDPLLEVKSIGLGTVRHEASHLLAKYTHKVELDNGDVRTLMDLDRLWREIKRPFPSHLRQGLLYCFLMQRSTIIFVYEFKPTQAAKEFVIKFRRSLIADLLELALDVKYAVKTGKAPVRPGWAKDATVEGCKTCVYRVKCWGTTASASGEQHETEVESGSEARRRVPRRQGSAGEGRAQSAREADDQCAGRADEDHGHGRLGADEPVRAPHSLAGLLERANGAGRDRRAIRRRPPGEA